MKKTILTLFLFWASMLLVVAQKQMNIITYNIRYNTPSDMQNAWPNRRGSVIELLKRHKEDIFSVQEALYDQIMDLKDGMSGFDYVGVGRDDGEQAGEYSAIFYKT